MAKGNLMRVVDGVAFFRDKVEGIVNQRGYDLSEQARWYLVDLLAAYIKVERFTRINGEDFFSKPLAIQLLEIELKGKKTPPYYLTLKQLGDTTLYLTGYFSDHFRNSQVGMNYYADLGALAYTRLSNLLERGNSTDEKIYLELSQKFHCMMEILGEMSEEQSLTATEDILQIYERWLTTRSERLKKWLESRGILLSEGGRQKIH